MPYYVRNNKLLHYDITYRGVMLNIMYNEEIKSIVFWNSLHKLKKWIRNLHPSYHVLGYEIVYRSNYYKYITHDVVVAFVPYKRKES